jgi:hypothetical protein
MARRIASNAVALPTLLAMTLVSSCAAHGETDPAGYDPVQEATGGSSDDGGLGGTGGSPATGGSGDGGTDASGGVGGSQPDGGSGGTGGASGEGGAGGSAGDAGTGGDGATGGSGGTGAAGGSGGAGGTGGTGAAGGMGGTAGTGGTGGGGGTGGTGGTGGGALCLQQPDSEPNDTQAQAQDLGTIDDCDSSESEVQGKLDGGSDRDWFTFGGKDTFGCSVNPMFHVMSASQVLLCVYFACGSGGTTVSCASGDVYDQLSGQYPGCCTSKTSMAPSINCSGLDDSSQVYMLAYSPTNSSCQSYAISYHY